MQIDGGRRDIGLQRLGYENHFHAAGGAEHMASSAFGGADGNLVGMILENAADGFGFANITLRRAGAVGVDVVEVVGIEPTAAQGHLHTTRRAFAIGRGGGEMIRIGGVAVPDDFTINFRITRPGVFQLLEHEHARAFAHHKAIASNIKRP